MFIQAGCWRGRRGDAMFGPRPEGATALEPKPVRQGSWLFRLYMFWMKRGATRL